MVVVSIVLPNRADELRATIYCLSKLADDMVAHEQKLDAVLTKAQAHGVTYDISPRTSFGSSVMTTAGGVKFYTYINHKWFWMVEERIGEKLSLQAFDTVPQFIEHVEKEVLT